MCTSCWRCPSNYHFFIVIIIIPRESYHMGRRSPAVKIVTEQKSPFPFSPCPLLQLFREQLWTIVTKGKARRGRGDFCSVTILFTLANFRTLLWYCFAMWIVFWSIEIWTKVTCSLHNLNKKTSLELDGPCDLTQAVFGICCL